MPKKQVLIFPSHWSCNPQIKVEESTEEGKFVCARVWTAYESEEPRIDFRSSEYPLEEVKLLTGKNAEEYWKIRAEQQKLGQRLDALLYKANSEEKPITWDWMVQHQTSTHVPVPYKHKLEIQKLRRGSLVVISGSSSKVARWIGTTGKIKRFNPIYAEIELKKGSRIKVPYCYLQPVKAVSKAELKKQKKNAELSRQVTIELNKVVSGMLK